jgi:hypothetical protein
VIGELDLEIGAEIAGAKEHGHFKTLKSRLFKEQELGTTLFILITLRICLPLPLSPAILCHHLE